MEDARWSPTRSRGAAVLGSSLILAVAVVLPFTFDVLVERGGSVRYSDLAYHLLLVERLWAGEVDTVYTVESQLRALASFLGVPVEEAMPVGVTPAALVVWAPWGAAARHSPSAAQSLWNGLSCLVLVGGLWSVRPRLQGPRTALLALCGLFSGLTVVTLALGQTSLAAAGALLAFVGLQERAEGARLGSGGPEEEPGGMKGGWPGAGLLLAGLLAPFLAMKPPYLALACGLLATQGRWREAGMVVGVFAALCGIATARLGWGWPGDYLAAIAVYRAPEVPEVYAGSLAWETTLIFRSAFRGVLGDPWAQTLTTVACAGTYLAAFGGGVVVRLRGGSAWRRAFACMTAGYLLFAPYAGAYELLLLLPLIPLTADVPGRRGRDLLLGVGVLVLFNHRTLLVFERPVWPFWLVELALLAWIVHAAAPQDGRPGAAPGPQRSPPSVSRP